MGNRVLRVIIYCITMLVISLPLISIAEEVATDKKEKKAEVKKEQDMSNWWTRNPLTFDPMPEDMLWHFESSYQFDRATGNWTTDNHMLTSQLSLRYNRFTNHVRYTFDKRNVGRPGDPPHASINKNLRDSTKHDVHEDFRYALTKNVYLAPGIFYLQDDYSYIDERLTYYLGIGGDVYSFKYSGMEVFKLSMFGAYGYETKRYIDEYHELAIGIKEGRYEDLKAQDPKFNPEEAIKRYDPGTEEGDVIYLTQTIRLLPYYGVMVTQECIYVADVSDRDIYRWTFKVGVDFKIMEHLFVSMEYKEEYDNDPNQLLQIRKRDQTIGTGIKVSF